MNIFWFEFIFFLVAIFAITVSVSTAALFFITYRHEGTIRNVWRAAGFLLLALGFFVYILERKFGMFGIAGVILEALAMFAIFRGVYDSPSLLHLAQTPKGLTGTDPNLDKVGKKQRKRDRILSSVLSIVVLLIILFAIINAVIVGNYELTTVFQIAVILFVLGTIVLQIQRLLRERKEVASNWVNAFPLIAYVFLFFRGMSMYFSRFGETNIVFLRKLTLDYSMTWLLALLFTLLAFIFLGIWAWQFIKYRVFLRTYVVFLMLAIVVATLGSFFFTLLVFNVVERNNLDLMTRGAETQELIMEDRSTTALFVAQLIADDNEFLAAMKAGNKVGMSERMETYMEDASVDILRIYSKFGEVLVSPTDIRDEGRVFNEDSVVAFTITEKTQVRTFGTEEGVLSSVMVSRSLHPLIIDGELLGAVEVGYRFDNAFVDYSKSATGLDVTIYTGTRRSATTIMTLDEVSRWTGSEETANQVLDTVFGQGLTYSLMTDRLGIDYYSAYKPIRNVNGDIIGMISVGIPANELIDDTRQQLITTFLIVILLSLLAAFAGYGVIKSLRKGDALASKKKSRKS